MYNPSSLNAEEFICHDEALASIAYASENRNNLGLVDSIIEKAERKKGLSHREASVLLACDVPEKVQKIYALAERIKQDIYGNRIRDVRTTVSVELLREWLRVLSIPHEKTSTLPERS